MWPRQLYCSSVAPKQTKNVLLQFECCACTLVACALAHAHAACRVHNWTRTLMDILESVLRLSRARALRLKPFSDIQIDSPSLPRLTHLRCVDNRAGRIILLSPNTTVSLSQCPKRRIFCMCVVDNSAELP